VLVLHSSERMRILSLSQRFKVESNFVRDSFNLTHYFGIKLELCSFDKCSGKIEEMWNDFKK
jgi:hypothetical protein